MEHVDLVGIILALGFVFWLAGGGSWVEEKVRQLSLENDKKELEIEKLKEYRDRSQSA